VVYGRMVQEAPAHQLRSSLLAYPNLPCKCHGRHSFQVPLHPSLLNDLNYCLLSDLCVAELFTGQLNGLQVEL